MWGPLLVVRFFFNLDHLFTVAHPHFRVASKLHIGPLEYFL